jgi:hypothetical protein
MAEESRASHADAHDEGMDIVYWYDDTEEEHWIYATGWVTEMEGGQVKGTRFATFKYDATHTGPGAPTATAQAFFPPLAQLQTGDTYKAVAMAVDPLTGAIYVAGEGPGASGQDYIVVKYDKDLDLDVLWPAAGATYNGLGNGDDIPADIIFDASSGIEYVVVTGTSPGDGTGLDIATVALCAEDGARAGAWPDIGDGAGVRRYDNDPVNGDDTAVELSYITITEEEQGPGLSVVVLGTSWNGQDNDYTTHVWSQPASALFWEQRYDNDGEDVARALGVVADPLGGTDFFVYVTGSSENASGDLDYATVFYDWAGNQHWAKRLDHVGDDDIPRDIHGWAQGHPGCGTCPAVYHVWVTGEGNDGVFSDVLTVEYVDDGTSPRPGVTWSGDWANGSAEYNYGKAITTFDGEPYITGAIGNSNGDEMLGLAYSEDLSGGYTHKWDLNTFGNAIPRTDDPNHEGRGIVVVPVDSGGVSIFITGVTRLTGEGRQFATWRYKE